MTAHQDSAAERLADLKDLMPDVFTEGKLDVEKLMTSLGTFVDARTERYHFSWNGRRDAMRVLQAPLQSTLVHEQGLSIGDFSTPHAVISGDNLESLRLLVKPYFGKVKLITIDPPYNTGNDFVYPDNWSSPLHAYLSITGQVDDKGAPVTTNRDTSGRFHSDWLSMMYPRLFLARQLLADDGVFFATIDDAEVHHLRLLLNEIFGEENFVTQIEWQKRYTRSNNTDDFTSVIDHVLVYRKSEHYRPNLMARDAAADARYANPDNDPRGPWKAIPFLNPLSPRQRPNLDYEIVNPNTGETLRPQKKAWRREKKVFEKLSSENRIWWGKDGRSKIPNVKGFLSEVKQGMTPINLWTHDFAGNTDDANREIKDLFGDKIFDTPKPTKLIRRMIELATVADEEALVLDFFAGSGTTGQAVLEANADDGGNRRFILIQLPEPTPPRSVARHAGYEDISAICIDRLRKVHKRLVGARQTRLSDVDDDGPSPVGFRVFRLAESQIRTWEPPKERNGEQWVEQMALYEDPLQPGWKPLDVVWEVALREGYPLTSTFESVGKGKTWKVTDEAEGRSFIVNLDDTLKPEVVGAIDLTKQTRFICRDIALTDEQAANLALQCDLRTL